MHGGLGSVPSNTKFYRVNFEIVIDRGNGFCSNNVSQWVEPVPPTYPNRRKEMATLPIISMFVLSGTDGHATSYIIFQYADHTRSSPIELTEEKIQELLSSFTGNEPLAFGVALSRPNHWVNV